MVCLFWAGFYVIAFGCCLRLGLCLLCLWVCDCLVVWLVSSVVLLEFVCMVCCFVWVVSGWAFFVDLLGVSGVSSVCCFGLLVGFCFACL